MGRPPNPPHEKNGVWYSRHPGLKRTVRLGATTFAEALAEQQSFYGVAHEPVTINQTIPSNPVSSGGNNGGSDVFNLDDDAPPTPAAKKADNAADLLSSWSKSTTPLASSGTDAVPVSAPSTTAGNTLSPPAPSAHPYAYTPVKGTAKPQKGLTPEQSAKIASGLKKMVVNTNIVVMASAVQMFGRVPAPLDQDEIALLQMGWEMWLDELFLKAKLKPIHLVIVGNLMIAVSMWAAGQPVKKPDPKTDPATSKAAPGHGASVTPITPPKG